jgi:ABC-type Mn2+/Zn2+ transport system ATPase subunit
MKDSLAFRNCTVCYGTTPAVHHLSAELPPGSLTGIIGRNGAGKSTLLRAVLGWLPLTTGAITLGDAAAADARERLHYLPQRSQIDWDFPVTVREVVAMGRHGRVGALRRFSADDQRAVDAALRELGLEALQRRQINALSGGQQQRTLLARAVASGADVFLLDEPFAALDPSAAGDLARRLRTWADQGRLVVAVAHELDLVRAHATHVLVMNNHLIAAGPVAEAMTDAHLAVAFGRPVVVH